MPSILKVNTFFKISFTKLKIPSKQKKKGYFNQPF